jgi:ribosome maturation factor RimP
LIIAMFFPLGSVAIAVACFAPPARLAPQTKALSILATSDTGGARERARKEEERARELGGPYSSMDAFVQDHLPESSQQRRRKKEWNPAKRAPGSDCRKPVKVRQNDDAAPTLSQQDLLPTARAVLADAAKGIGVELVGAVLTRPPRGPKQAGSFKCWIEATDGVSPAVLSEASTALRDALWATIPGKPDITTIAAGQSRPLFTLTDFQRFRGQRAQLTFRNAVGGRRNLVGELLGAEAGTGDDSEPFAIILDETKGERLHAPLSQLQLGEATALVPAATTTQAQREPRARAREGVRGRAALAQQERAVASALSAAAAKTVEAALAAAPIVAFVGADCASSRRVLELLRDAGCAGATLRVVEVDRHLESLTSTAGLDEGVKDEGVKDVGVKDVGVKDEGVSTGVAAGVSPLTGADPGTAVYAIRQQQLAYAIRQQLELRTGQSAVPCVLLAGVKRLLSGGARPLKESGASPHRPPPYDGWVGGVDDLELLVAAGPGRLQARLMEASFNFASAAAARTKL